MASGWDNPWTPPWGGVSDTSIWEETPGQTWEMLYRLDLSAALGFPQRSWWKCLERGISGTPCWAATHKGKKHNAGSSCSCRKHTNSNPNSSEWKASLVLFEWYNNIQNCKTSTFTQYTTINLHFYLPLQPSFSVKRDIVTSVDHTRWYNVWVITYVICCILIVEKYNYMKLHGST